MRGSIEDVLHRPEHAESEVFIRVTELLRQSHTIFTDDKSEQLVRHMTRETGSERPSNDLRVRSDVVRSKDDDVIDDLGVKRGVIIMPHKCGIKHGAGEFLFMGRVRLGRAVLGCAPRAGQFQTLWDAAVKAGDNLCLLK